MFLLTLFAMSGVFYNDVLALISILGSIILFFGSFPYSPLKRLTGLAEWNIAPLVFGTFFQICLFLSGLMPEYQEIGFLIPMPQALVNALFGASILLMTGHWWLSKVRFKTP